MFIVRSIMGVFFSGDAEEFFSSSVDDGVSAVLEISSSTNEVSCANVFVARSILTALTI